MIQWFYLILMTFFRKRDQLLMAQIQYLKAENEILQSRIKNNFITKPHERTILLQYGLPLGSSLKDIISIVTYKTFLRWKQEYDDPDYKPKRIGRPRTSETIRQLIIRMAIDNAWGYTRIKGELSKLCHTIGRSTIQRVLKLERIPDPYNRKDSAWHHFIQREAQSLWACDFFCQPVFSLFGKKFIWVLVFIHIGSRKVYYAGCTAHPKADWVEQKARQFCWRLNENKESFKYLLRDRDGKYSKKFDQILKSEGINVRRLPRRSPNLNAWIESWIGSLKRECLNHFLVLNEKHLDHLMKEYVAHYNTERPHQSMDNKPLIQLPISSKGDVKCKERLGGVLKHYYREAA